MNYEFKLKTDIPTFSGDLDIEAVIRFISKVACLIHWTVVKMEFDEYDYLEKTVENTEPHTAKETANGGGDAMKPGDKDSSRSSKHKSNEKDDGDDDRHRSKRSKSGDESRDYRQR
ncbi:hypothetical protein GH714_032698 [Hevea brasiliensis]|uniref:Uncharacterized protein n=1 Tax=Hevea brasiliensis TaxID=3981 RepID=A0A6A6LPV0_HEVBR|nr:hypothetical protein GH714_032698 [Hevea brasiliensis]